MEWVLGFWVWFLSVVALACLLFKNNNNNNDKIHIQNKPGIPKGSLGWPFLGETLAFIASGYSSRPVTFMNKRKSLYGSVFKTNILGTPIIVSTDSDVNKVVLQNHGNTFVPAYPKSITELLGSFSILQMNGNFQKRIHSIIGAFLKSPSLKARITTDIQNTVKLRLSNWNTSKLVYVQTETKQITFEVLVKVLMSVGPGEDLKILKREFEEFIKALICIPVKLPGTRLYKSLKAREKLLKIVSKIVEERRSTAAAAEEEEEKVPPRDAVDVLLQDNDVVQGLPLDFISSHIIELMIPGEETVPMAMTLAVKFLSDCPVALAQMMEENMELKKQKDDSGEEYTWTDYMSLLFTQNVISETLRMANIINGVWRKAQKDVEIKGYLIPQGWCVLASFISVHMDENNYTNSHQFDPWRWEGIGSGSNNQNFTPFGGGQRLCPGIELARLEISIFLHHLVTTYKWGAERDEIIHFPTVRMRRKLPIAIAKH
ncbi:3-epi-6-deoxocathasterone 23-monooxygenase [Cucurbita pepo subsp. pepo]|uniref:3-epi-6-deoxocathasterone 23-monooxygenase n=1 Tax=Cucurbita pepo subsp. pepo TaxID=3664 RepID=UPI000C9D7D3D|nr:3-epi-6-deoxocathasterone 23-monooxygenase [Cucurbita pepo subsp. pepo]